jgi:hypothetical protein
VINTVDINAPDSIVFQYLGNSASASDWSTFVDHITPLNAQTKKDGQAGSIRRVFRHANEKGMTWDELIMEVNSNKRRQLSIYNIRESVMAAKGLYTEQVYEKLSPTKTRLSFTLFLKEEEAGFMDKLKMYMAAYKVKPVFVGNMRKIKEMVESGSGKSIK